MHKLLHIASVACFITCVTSTTQHSKGISCTTHNNITGPLTITMTCGILRTLPPVHTDLSGSSGTVIIMKYKEASWVYIKTTHMPRLPPKQLIWAQRAYKEEDTDLPSWASKIHSCSVSTPNRGTPAQHMHLLHRSLHAQKLPPAPCTPPLTELSDLLLCTKICPTLQLVLKGVCTRTWTLWVRSTTWLL